MAGLWEFPSVDLPVPNSLTSEVRLHSIATFLEDIFLEPLPPLLLPSIESKNKIHIPRHSDTTVDQLDSDLESIHHVFSHLKVEYKPARIIISSPNPPVLKNPCEASRKGKESQSAEGGQARWTMSSSINKSNIGNAHKKIWGSITSKDQDLGSQETGSKRSSRSTTKQSNQSCLPARKKKKCN